MSRKYVLTNYYTDDKIKLTGKCPFCGTNFDWKETDLGEDFTREGLPTYFAGNWYAVGRISYHKKLKMRCPKCKTELNVEYSDYEIVDE